MSDILDPSERLILEGRLEFALAAITFARDEAKRVLLLLHPRGALRIFIHTEGGRSQNEVGHVIEAYSDGHVVIARRKPRRSAITVHYSRVFSA